MKGLENQSYLIGFIAFNLLAILFVVASIKMPRFSRGLFFLLFGWACWMNWTYSQNNPEAYQEYSALTFSNVYKEFITGWFKSHTALMVGVIATCQGLIAISMWLKGVLFKIGSIGGIVFLLAIAPLGVGSGFPCTVVFAIALTILYRKGNNFLWLRKPAYNSLPKV